MIKRAYINGFIRKCAENGVNPRALLKYSEERPGHEIAGRMIAGHLPFVSMANPIAYIAGAMDGRDVSPDDVDKSIEERDNVSNYIPGVGAYRQAQRALALATLERDLAKRSGKKEKATSNIISEELGILNPLNLLIGQDLGRVVGGMSTPRTLEEQLKHDSTSHKLRNLLIPGYAGYQASMRLGASQKEHKRRKEEKEKRKEKKDND